MSSSTESCTYRSGSYKTCFMSTGSGHQRWTAVNITAMVLGFVLFWPIGLVMLFWILSGRDVAELPGAIRQKWRWYKGEHSRDFSGTTDNVVFNEYQQTQRDKIREIEEEISTLEERFRTYRANAQRRKDRAEFEDFMSESPLNQ